jgi:flagellar motor protein MotB
MDDKIAEIYAELELLIDQQKNFLLDEAIVKATNLAASGDFTKSKEILENRIDSSPDHDSYDLLARIEAQSGNLDLAEKHWHKALSYQSNCPDCISALARIQKIKKSSVRKDNSRLFYLSTLLVLFCMLILSIYLLINQNSFLKNLSSDIQDIQQYNLAQNAEPQSYQELPIVDIESIIQPDIDNLSNELIELDKKIEIINNNQVDTLNIVQELQLQASDSDQNSEVIIDSNKLFIVKDDKESSVIEFKAPLFLFEGILTEYGFDALKELGNQLAKIPEGYEVIITGYSDNLEDKERLSVERAKIAATVLSEYSRIPIENFRIRPVGSLPSLFPNDTNENRYLNRTVSIKINRK